MDEQDFSAETVVILLLCKVTCKRPKKKKKKISVTLIKQICLTFAL